MANKLFTDDQQTRISGLNRKNLIINGDFDICYRGSSFNSVGYFADRWKSNNLSGTTFTFTRQSFTVGQTDVPDNPVYFGRLDITAGSLGSRGIEQRIEDVKTAAGKTITVSMYIKTDSAQTLDIYPYQNFGSGGSSSVTITGQSFTTSTSWQKFTAIFEIPSISGKTLGSGNYLGLSIRLDDVTTCTLDISHVQLEIGDAATDFEYKHITTERLLCARYWCQ